MKIIVNILLIILVLSLSGKSQAQTAELSGKVININNNEPLADAIIFISYGFMKNTNGDGNYNIKNIPYGKYTVRVSRLGYKSLISEVEINELNVIKNFKLESSLIELGDVIVSTDRKENYLRNSPYSGSFVAQKDIKEKSFQTLPNILSEETGVSLMRDGIWGTEINIRGLSKENIVILIDGSRVSTSTDVAARLSMLNLNDIDRVEIIKGAASSIYGSGATGGIINIINNEPEFYSGFKIKGNINTGFNSVNQLSTFAGTLNGGDKYYSAKFSGSYRKAQNTQTPVGELENSQFMDYSYSGSINIIPFDNHLFKVNYQSFRAEDVGIPGASVFPASADVRYPDETRKMFSSGYEFQNISKVLYKLSIKYSHQIIGRNVENIPNIVQNIPSTSTEPAKRVSVLKITPRAEHTSNNIQLQGNLMLNKFNNLILGIDYWDRSYSGDREKYQLIEVLDQQGNVVNSINKVFGEKPLPLSKYSSIGAYAQNDTEIIIDKFYLSLGARIDKIKVTGEKTLNPVYEITNGTINYSPANQKVIWNEVNEDDYSYSANAGLRYSLTGNLDFTLSMGLSFRSPSLEERFQYIDQGSFVRVGSPNLQSEKGKSIDLGIRYYSENLKILSSIFYNYFDDLVSEIPGTFDGRNAFIKTNIGKARLYGLDYRTDYNFYENYVFYFSFSFVKGDDLISKTNLSEIPPLNGMAGIKFDLFGFADAEFNTSIAAKQKDNAISELETPGYAIFNFYCASNVYKFGEIGLQISAGIENILDKEYRNHLSTNRGFIKIEPGRNLFLKANINW